MARDEDRAPPTLRRTALVFAYVCFGLATAMIAAAVYLLPLGWKVKLFLSLAILLLLTMFGFLAIAAHLVSRPSDPPRPNGRPGAPRSPGKV